MSNFTRSILYSTSVLVAGLVAIFAIYNDVANAPDAAAVAQISPAAGGSDLGITYDNDEGGNILDDVSFDAPDVIGPVDDADDIKSDEATDEEKGSSIDGDRSFKVAQAETLSKEEIKENIDTETIKTQIDQVYDQAARQAPATAGPEATSNYKSDRQICYYDYDYEREHGSYRYWFCRPATFEEDVEYYKEQSKSQTDATIDRAVNRATNETMGSGSSADMSNNIRAAVQDSVNDALSDISDPAVRSDIQQKIEEELSRRGL